MLLCKKVWSNFDTENGILWPKLFWPTVKKECSSDWEKLLKFEAEGREFAKIFKLVPGGFSYLTN